MVYLERDVSKDEGGVGTMIDKQFYIDILRDIADKIESGDVNPIKIEQKNGFEIDGLELDYVTNKLTNDITYTITVRKGSTPPVAADYLGVESDPSI